MCETHFNKTAEHWICFDHGNFTITIIVENILINLLTTVTTICHA